MKHRVARWLTAIFVAALVAGQGTWALAGTTGVVSGTVVQIGTNAPVVNAKVTVASPSQTASTLTDKNGHFVFLNLAPDTYTVSVDGSGLEPTSQSGVNVVADQTRELSLSVQKALTTIVTVKTRAAGSLVKPGTTADVYSIGAGAQQKVAAAGGGGNLDSAWSALATVPGVAIAPGQQGYIGAAATISIRGGDYDQIGYQIDGVPVNRAFDNYPSGPASSLGQQELQVYTGGPPASSTSEGISGYINQVIRTGTYPGFANFTIAAGSPSYYHKVSFEFGGATSNRRLSYYVGLGGYNQDYRYVDQFNGAGVSNLFGQPVGVCDAAATSGPVSCFNGPQNQYTNNSTNAYGGSLILNGYQNWLTSTVIDRDNVVNLHYYIPHANGTRDDFQALYMVNFLQTQYYGSPNDLGGAAYLNAIGTGAPTFVDGYALNLPTGGFLPSQSATQALASQYYFPSTPSHGFGGAIPANERDGFNNDQAIVKLQYTKALGTNAIARLYGYTYYSDWLQTGPNCTTYNYNCNVSADYELSAHTRGLSLQLSDQINSQNLLQLNGDWTNSSVLRSNNTQMTNGGGLSRNNAVGALVDSNNPYSGLCYTAGGVEANCYASAFGLNKKAAFVTIKQAYQGAGAYAAATGTCGTGPCQYLVVGNGQIATYNQVQPTFWGASLTDEFRPTSKITLNAGARVDIYQYQGANTSGTAARTFWYNAYNRDQCLDAQNNITSKATLGLDALAACPTGYTAPNFQNPSGVVTQTYSVWQPRLGATYTVDPSTVIRASYGRYAQPPNSAFEQYNTLQANTPATIYGVYGFQKFGFTTPNHPIPPATSNNYDLSLEHEFPDQIGVKLTPFYRSTQNQIQQFFLNQATGFVSGLNVGNQTSRGFELEVDKGDFSQQGVSAKLSFAYTNSYIKYNHLSNGSTVLDPINAGISQYNGFTKSGGGAPCYFPAGTAANSGTPDFGCAAGSVANPYYNQAPQGLLPTGGNYATYDTFPQGQGVSAVAYGFPYVASLVLNERIKQFSIAPILQLFAGTRYGSPLDTNGIDPSTCGATLAGTTAGDPRYPKGAAGGSPFDAASCGTLTGIPNQFTGHFDGIGQYVEPTQLLLAFQLTYEPSKNLQLVANLANVVNTCFGGTTAGFKVPGTCLYGVAQGGNATGNVGQGSIGNLYNPGQALQPYQQLPYFPNFTQQPFGAYLSANFRI